jgi:Protein of unknown function (DUF2934)
MQISSTNAPAAKPVADKAKGKSPSRTKKTPPPETLHLKAKDLVATPADDLVSMIATAAYYCAQRRGFEPGHELEDWLRAEQQVRSRLS